MTAAIESLSLSKLEERRDTLLRYVAVVEEEIQIRKANSSDSSLFKLFTSFKRTEDSKQSSNSKKVDEVKKAKDTKKVEEVKKAKPEMVTQLDFIESMGDITPKFDKFD